MEIRLLGTGAAEGIPALYSGSRVSACARQFGGREVRTRSGALIDGHLKVDFPPDTLMQLHRDGLDARDWSAVFFTHSHDDHFAVDEIQYGLLPFSEEEALPFTIFGNSAVIARLEARYPGWPMDLQQTASFEPVAWGEYTITPIRARHMVGEEDAHNLIVEDGEKSFLYGTDTGRWTDETWAFLSPFRLDGIALECTSGRIHSDYEGHHDLQSFLATVDGLRAEGILKPGARVVSTHHSHNGDLTYAELAEALAPFGIEAGYDGMAFEV
jgi:phosphoribosyl 1,2-cyclic phosphate phosphodiesterase